jgi:hypothetical protein
MTPYLLVIPLNILVGFFQPMPSYSSHPSINFKKKDKKIIFHAAFLEKPRKERGLRPDDFYCPDFSENEGSLTRWETAREGHPMQMAPKGSSVSGVKNNDRMRLVFQVLKKRRL